MARCPNAGRSRAQPERASGPLPNLIQSLDTALHASPISAIGPLVENPPSARQCAVDSGFDARNERLTDLSWRKVVWWSHRDLCRLGIEIINLLCATGLPGAEHLDLGLCVRKLDEWAEKVRVYTAMKEYLFERHPERYGHSHGYFEAFCLVECLQRECGIRFNPAKRDPACSLDVADSFIFGIVQGDGGTCASLPVLYCAIGHRLGYPMYLVRAKGDGATHLFVGWDDEEVRFNIEATAEGLATPTDDHYRMGRFAITPEMEARAYFLKPNNMRQSLAVFLAERAAHWKDLNGHQHALESMSWAAALHPENELYLNTAQIYRNDWLRELDAQKPPLFPGIVVTEIKKRRFPRTVPLEFELATCGIETMACLLNDPRHERDMWAPLRRGAVPARPVPSKVECVVHANQSKDVHFVFE